MTRINSAASRSKPPMSRQSAPGSASRLRPAGLRLPTSARRLDAYKVAMQLVAFVQPLMARIAQHDKDLAHQMRRSLPSIPHNLTEGLRRTGNDRAHLLTVALGSADELRTSIDIAACIGSITPTEAQTAEQLADRICAMLFRLHQRA